MKFYRYEIGRSEMKLGVFADVKISLQEFVLIKETPKRYWISNNWITMLHLKPKWVSKTATKRYAYPSKEEALIGAKARTARRIKILESQLEIAKAFLFELQSETSILNEIISK